MCQMPVTPYCYNTTVPTKQDGAFDIAVITARITLYLKTNICYHPYI